MISQQKIKEWVDMYLNHIKEITPVVHVSDEKEGYKFKAVDIFQQNFDINAKDFVSMIDKAIVSNNLVMSSWYYPRKMLLIFAKEYLQETKTAIENLFNEDLPVAERIDKTKEIFDHLVADYNKQHQENFQHFIKVRFLSVLLSYRYPEKYNALKPREWRDFCNFIDDEFLIPKGASNGEQYNVFSSHVEALRQYIKDLPAIIEFKKQFTVGLKFQDEEFRWMAQDIIFVTSSVRSKTYESELELSGNQPEILNEEMEEDDRVPATTKDKFSYEDDLENFIIENFDQLGLGDGIKIYTDQNGERGQYYSTDVGEIDILALDSCGNFIVIELKSDYARDKAVGQVLRYMGWVQKNLATQGQMVRGIIICGRDDKGLIAAASTVADKIDIKIYRLNIELRAPII